MKYQITEVFSNGNSNILGIFNIEKEAKTFFEKQLKDDGYKPEDLESCEVELQKVILDEDGDIEDIEVLISQTIYNEGTMDRYNFKGNNALNYGFESVWNAEKKQLIYTFYFHGEKEKETVLEENLSKWYY